MHRLRSRTSSSTYPGLVPLSIRNQRIESGIQESKRQRRKWNVNFSNAIENVLELFYRRNGLLIFYLKYNFNRKTLILLKFKHIHM